MGDINLLPEDSRHAPRHHRPVKGRVEYSSVTNDTHPAPAPASAVPPPPSDASTSPSIVPTPLPQKRHDTFAEWWKHRRAHVEKSESALTTRSAAAAFPASSESHSVPTQKKKQTQSTEHGAPQKTEDIVQMDLVHPLHPANPVHPTQSTPPIRRYVPTPATVQAPQLIRTMPRSSKPTHGRAQPQRMSPGQPRPAADHETVNLLPDQLITELHPRNRVRDLVVTALSGCVLVLLVYGGMNLYQQKIVVDTKQVEEEIAAVDTTIASYAALQTKAQEIDRRLGGLESVLDSHVMWTPFLTAIEELTLPTVYYTSLSGSAASGSFTFDAVTAKYDQIDPQVRVFRAAPQVRAVTVSSAHEVTIQPTATTDSTPAAEGTSAVAFTMSVEFDPSLFHASSVE